MRRRELLGAALLLPIEGLAQTCGVITPRQTEGPFFKTNSPRRISLVEGGSKAPRFVVTGTPGGVGARRTPPIWMKPGDKVEIEIDKVGVLENTIVDG